MAADAPARDPCALTDPVVRARRPRRCAFPNVAGWSAEHAARRAVAEHAAWLGGRALHGGPARELPLLVSAARAGLFFESVRDGAPTLTLTAAATLRALASRAPAGAIDGAAESYRILRHDGVAPAGAPLAELRAAVTDLAAYRGVDGAA